MRFVETPIFTKKVLSSIEDENYRALQLALVLRPEQGKLIAGTGGLRKIRWAGKGHGKRGGYRMIYYWDKPTETIYMLYVYPKNEQEELTSQQRKLLSSIVREEFK
jgi:mRNA-degrading endonuclease RelE of RelBE toxin-antitoxin system